MSVELLSEVCVDHSMLVSMELLVKANTCLKLLQPLKNYDFNRKVIHVEIAGDQDSAVMGMFFSLPLGSLRSLTIRYSNLSLWMEQIRVIGSKLLEITVKDRTRRLPIINTIIKYCPYLEKLSMDCMVDITKNNHLESIANKSSYLRVLYVRYLNYISSTEADAALTAFAGKCPRLEELSRYCRYSTDQSVIALAQHCSRLKKLTFSGLSITPASLIALSERGLPLEELDIPSIPIPSAEIAAQCDHALSRIRKLPTYSYEQ